MRACGNRVGATIGSPVGLWMRSCVIAPKPVAIEAQDFEPIRVERTPDREIASHTQARRLCLRLRPESSPESRDYVVKGPAGADVRLRFAEVLNADGTLYTDNLRTAKATDHFILSGNGSEEFVPQFTFHGFRYAELTGLPAAPIQGQR
jgi:alpha-L-rhamnosidase